MVAWMNESQLKIPNPPKMRGETGAKLKKLIITKDHVCMIECLHG